MATPAYQGQGQPIADNGGGWLGRLGSYFGGATAPVYATAPAVTLPQPTPDPKSGGDTPITVARPVMTCPIDPDALASGQIVLVVPRETADGRIVIDPDALASGQIAIVVPRSLLMTP